MDRIDKDVVRISSCCRVIEIICTFPKQIRIRINNLNYIRLHMLPGSNIMCFCSFVHCNDVQTLIIDFNNSLYKSLPTYDREFFRFIILEQNSFPTLQFLARSSIHPLQNSDFLSTQLRINCNLLAYPIRMMFCNKFGLQPSCSHHVHLQQH